MSALATPLPSGRKPRRDDEFVCLIEGFGKKGGVTGRWGEYRADFRAGAVGALVRARVAKRRKGHLDADVLEVLDPSPDAVEPRCAHAASCGGCSYQDISYAAQVAELNNWVRRQLEPLAIARDFELAPVEPCPQPWAYRNKMDFTFSNRRWIEAGEPEQAASDFALGLHVAGRFEKVLDIQRCEIQFEEGNPILASARELALELKLAPWDIREHTGLLRHLVLRKGVYTDELMVNLVTSGEESPALKDYLAAMLQRHPSITTLVQNINTRAASIAVGEREVVHHGPGFITEDLDGLRFEISAGSFFQTNSERARRLMEVVREEAACSGNETVYDLYCGAGLLGLAIHRSAGNVIGIELEASAVADARRNAKRNGATNLRFLQGDASLLITRSERGRLGLPDPDLCLIDPPRAGLHPRATDDLLTLAAPRLVYVSCNLHSALRDVAPLLENGYSLLRVRPLDLFPHTPHLESVLTLVRES